MVSTYKSADSEAASAAFSEEFGYQITIEHNNSRTSVTGNLLPNGLLVRIPKRIAFDDPKIVGWMEEFIEHFRDRLDKLPKGVGMPKEDVEALVEEWARVIGVTPTSIRWANLSARWASMNEKGSLIFSNAVTSLPERLVEYLIVHELSHLYHFTVVGLRKYEDAHGKKFWEIVEGFQPDFAERKKELATYGRGID